VGGLTRIGIENGPVYLEMTGGTLETLGTSYQALGLAWEAGSEGILNMRGGTITTAYGMIVGRNGTGRFYMSGGIANVNNLLVGRSYKGYVEISDGTINSDSDVEIARGSRTEGYLDMTGGVININGKLMAGIGSESVGRANISGGTVYATDLYDENGLNPSGDGKIDVTGSGKIILTGQDSTNLANYILNGYLTANGNADDVVILEYQDGGEWYTSVTAVPEPASIMLFGICGFALIRKCN
jgi:hypothetical protein